MLTGEQIRRARETLGWSRADLSRRTSVPLAVLDVVEDHGSTFMLLASQMTAIRDVFEDAGIVFTGGGTYPKFVP